MFILDKNFMNFFSKLLYLVMCMFITGTQRQGLMVDDIGNFTCRELLGGEQHNLELYIMCEYERALFL